MEIYPITEREGSISVTTCRDGECPTKRKLEGRKILRKQLKAAELKNSELQISNAENEKEISELKKHINSLNDIINSVQVEDLGKGSTVATTKIMEMSKKNRQLTSELESWKTKYSKVDIKIRQLELELKKVSQVKELKDSPKKATCCNSASSLESICEQLQTTKQKLFDSLNQNTELKNNMKLAQKCLQQEIGEHFNLNILAASNSNWRGRSQQILSLQNKVNELKEKLELSNSGDDTTAQQLRKIELMRKNDIEVLTSQLKEAKTIIDEQKAKMSALKTRNRNLVDDTMNYKMKTLNLMEKSGDSESSIAVLNEKLNMQKYQYENKITEIYNDIQEMENSKRDIEIDNTQLRLKLEKMESVIQSKEQSIDELNNIIKRLETDLRAVCGDFLFSCRDLKKEEYIAILDALESEKERLLKYTNELNERLENEREKFSNLTEQLSKHRVKYSRLDAKLKDLQREQDAQQDKKRRSQRIADYSKSVSSGLSTLIIENSNSMIDIPQQSDSMELEIEDLKNKLELSNERISFLQEKIDIIAKEKDSDTKMFNEIILNSKNILLNIIQQNHIHEFSMKQDDINSNNNTKRSEENGENYTGKTSEKTSENDRKTATSFHFEYSNKWDDLISA